MNKNQYQKKMAMYVLLASGATFLASNSFAKTETPKTHPADTIDRVAASAKHKALTEKAQSIEGEAAEIEAETQKAILALDKNERGRVKTRTNLVGRLNLFFALLFRSILANDSCFPFFSGPLLFAYRIGWRLSECKDFKVEMALHGHHRFHQCWGSDNIHHPL